MRLTLIIHQIRFNSNLFIGFRNVGPELTNGVDAIGV